MLKAIWGFIRELFGLNSPSVKKAVKRHINKRIEEAEDAVKQDVQIAKAELQARVAESVDAYVVEKEAALKRQVNAILTRLLD